LTPFFSSSLGALYSEDCLKVLRGLRSETIDMIFADPPFNIGKDYQNGYQDRRPKAEYFSWCQEWIREGSRLLRSGGAFFLYSTPELAIQFSRTLEESLCFHHWIALTMKGTFPRGERLYPAHYALLYYLKGSPRAFSKIRTPIEVCRHCGGEIRDYGGHRRKMHPDGVSLSDFWTDTSPNRHRGTKNRPGVNELKLMIPERAILISTNPGDIILDPFGGGGSTFHAAQLHQRRWIGMELFDADIIRERISREFPGSSKKLPGFDLDSLFA
jgi:site-specific DNA-methyltransferase (adenine-specific)